MPFLVHPDGSITTDTLDEAIQVARALAQAGVLSPASAPVAEPASGANSTVTVDEDEAEVEEEAEEPQPRHTHWTKALARDYLAALPKPEYVTMVRQVLEADEVITILEFMAKWDYQQSGIGRRFKTLKDASAQVAPDLSPAVKLGGRKGAKEIHVNFGFAAAAREVFSE